MKQEKEDQHKVVATNRKAYHDYFVDETFEAGRRILDRHLALVRAKNEGARAVLLEGNHEYRTVKYRVAGVPFPALL